MSFKKQHQQAFELLSKVFLYGWIVTICILAAYGLLYLLAGVVGDGPLSSILVYYGTPVLAVVLLLLVGNFYVYHGFGSQADIYRRGSEEEKKVALTFDDGPNPTYTPAILEILRRYGVPATFFLLGSQVDAYPELPERMVSEGHEVGIHSYDHLNLTSLSTPALSSQIFQTIVAILNAGGKYPRFLRPPRGLYNAQLRRLAELLGLRIVLWSLSSEDWMPGKSPEAVVNRILNRVQPGDILLFHDGGGLINGAKNNRKHTVQALPQIIEGLEAAGYEIVPLTELLDKASPEVECPGEVVFSQDF
ncbi:MAG: polysaccharide deacetylase family protein [Firmicutes bacterium]|nr:polysaccharide deacetylase family protein [Bacillota bacterium]